MSVSYAVGLPNVGEFGDPLVLVELAIAAEEHGWDGVFLSDHVLYHDPAWPVVNPTVVLSAVATRTAVVRLGAMMTALPRRRVQVVAREYATLDVLSGGRMVFGAALGSMEAEYAAFGEDPSLPVRAGRLDESLTVLDRLWSGERVDFAGRHLTVDGVRMVPTPVQRPRVPIWCAGRLPVTAGLKRAARWDGVMPTHADVARGEAMPATALREALAVVAAQRGGLDGFDVALEGRTGVVGGARVVAGYADAGLTWWVEAMGWWRGGVAEALERITAGPPVL